jgi:hypothetical protein
LEQMLGILITEWTEFTIEPLEVDGSTALFLSMKSPIPMALLKFGSTTVGPASYAVRCKIRTATEHGGKASQGPEPTLVGFACPTLPVMITGVAM